jgi:hypothetical protein
MGIHLRDPDEVCSRSNILIRNTTDHEWSKRSVPSEKRHMYHSLRRQPENFAALIVPEREPCSRLSASLSAI